MNSKTSQTQKNQVQKNQIPNSPINYILGRKSAISLLSFYILFRWGLDFLWREVSVYYSYLFEFAFVGIIFYLTRGSSELKFSCKLSLRNVIEIFLVGLFGGAFVFQMASWLGLAVPFVFDSAEIFFLILVVAPILEELIYHFALWTTFSNLHSAPIVRLLGTSLMFSVGHFIAFFYVPNEFKGFVIYQTIYVFFLGLAAGIYLLRTNKLTFCILLHFAFNLGFVISGL